MLFRRFVLVVVAIITIVIVTFAFGSATAFANYAVYPRPAYVNLFEIAVLLIVMAGLAAMIATAIIKRSRGIDNPDDFADQIPQQVQQESQEPQVLPDVPNQPIVENTPRLSIDIEKIPK